MDVVCWRKGDKWIDLRMWEKESLKPKEDTAQPLDQRAEIFVSRLIF